MSIFNVLAATMTVCVCGWMGDWLLPFMLFYVFTDNRIWMLAIFVLITFNFTNETFAIKFVFAVSKINFTDTLPFMPTLVAVFVIRSEWCMCVVCTKTRSHEKAKNYDFRSLNSFPRFLWRSHISKFVSVSLVLRVRKVHLFEWLVISSNKMQNHVICRKCKRIQVECCFSVVFVAPHNTFHPNHRWQICHYSSCAFSLSSTMWISSLMRKVHIHFHILRGIETITEHGMAIQNENGIKTTESVERREKKICHTTATRDTRQTKSMYICCLCVCEEPKEPKKMKFLNDSWSWLIPPPAHHTDIYTRHTNHFVLYGNFRCLSYHLFVLLLLYSYMVN